MASRTRKILVLHGYSQNADIARKWFAPVAEAFATENVELVFVDGAIALREADLPIGLTPTPETPFIIEIPKTQDDPELVPRGWWRAPPSNRMGIESLDESIAKFRDILMNDDFEGVLGFSQGSTMAVILSALLEKPEAYPSFLVDGKSPHPPFSFCIAMSGFLPVADLVNAVFKSGYETPTLHIHGKTDFITDRQLTEDLIKFAAAKNRKHLMHEGGHVIPLGAQWMEVLLQFTRSPAAELTLPEGASRGD